MTADEARQELEKLGLRLVLGRGPNGMLAWRVVPIEGIRG